ncbi:MAG: NAD(P)H-hydrate epimerase, partial [Bacteroidota bacterium]
MKILPVQHIREADAYTIQHEPVSGIDLMERASSACFNWLKANISPERTINVFCGSGNNGGDGLAIARMMSEAGFQVRVFTFSPPGMMSESCRINFLRMQECRNAGMRECREMSDLGGIDRIPGGDVVIDALFGSGLSRP